MNKLYLAWVTAKDVFLHFLYTGKVVDRTGLADKRLYACRTCTHYRATAGVCLVCGCYMQVKTRLIASRCPFDKW